MPLESRTNIYIEDDSTGGSSRTERLNRQQHMIAEIKCQGDGATRRTDYTPQKKFRPKLVSSTAKRAERQRIVKAATQDRVEPSFKTIATEIVRSRGWKSVVYHKDLVPASWFTPHPCYDVSIFFYVEYFEREVDVRLKRAMTLGGESYGKDEEIGDMLFLRPAHLKLRILRRFNSECCRTAPEEEPLAHEEKDYAVNHIRRELARIRQERNARLEIDETD